MDKKNNKRVYKQPTVKAVSFMVEQGFAGSAKIGDTSTLTPTFGTQKLSDQDSWNVTWRESANS